jgi:hypothetical protein
MPDLEKDLDSSGPVGDGDEGGSTREKDDDAVQPLGQIVEQEARRAVAETQLKANPERLADGWERRFLADPVRAKEAVELYTAMGFEVVADPVRPDELGEECEACRLLAQLHFKTIYTRKKS